MPKPPPFTIKFMKWKTFCVVQPYSGTRSWFLTTWICRQQTAGKLQFLHEKEQKQLRWWHVATGEYEGKSGDAGVCGAEGIEGDVLPSGGMAGVHPPVSSDRREPTHLWDVHGNLERQREREREESEREIWWKYKDGRWFKETEGKEEVVSDQPVYSSLFSWRRNSSHQRFFVLVTWSKNMAASGYKSTPLKWDKKVIFFLKRIDLLDWTCIKSNRD